MNTRVIVLTDWLPLTILHADWPVQVVAQEFTSLGEFALRVREHRSGRVIVYTTHGSHITGETYGAAGEVLEPGEDVAEAIRRVGLAARVPASLVGSAIAQLWQLEAA